jgi:hypothetical protein
MYKTEQWTVSDPDKDDFALVKAETQREAIIEAVDRGIRPSRSSDARPRTGYCLLMSRSEFNNLMAELDTR